VAVDEGALLGVGEERDGLRYVLWCGETAHRDAVLDVLVGVAAAGLVFNYTGAAAYHLAVGDGAGMLVALIIFTGLAVASWALRPSARRNLAPS
jgi:hypothetical protein